MRSLRNHYFNRLASFAVLVFLMTTGLFPLAHDYNDEFNSWLAESETLAQDLCDTLKAGPPAGVTVKFQALEQSCKQCHEKYRN